jgi:hypothetical protein
MIKTYNTILQKMRKTIDKSFIKLQKIENLQTDPYVKQTSLKKTLCNTQQKFMPLLFVNIKDLQNKLKE